MPIYKEHVIIPLLPAGSKRLSLDTTGKWSAEQWIVKWSVDVGVVI
jgi:hypothetical protein